jgi:hypothetical protein
MEYYSAIIKDAILSFLANMDGAGDHMFHETSQAQKGK